MTDTDRWAGKFVWREVMTPDVEKAKGFYGELFGWRFEDSGMEGMQYLMIRSGERTVGGMMKMDAGAEHPPHWMSYVAVPDVDAAAETARAEGGQVPVGPMDIPNVGRFAVVGDPDGAYLTVFRDANPDAPSDERPPVGTFCWETLATKDIARATDFYGKVAGLKPMEGPNGIPTLAAADGTAVADVQKAEGMPPSWSTYVVVPSLADATAKVEQLGGTLVVPRIDIPGVGAIAFFADPTGAFLGLFEAGQIA